MDAHQLGVAPLPPDVLVDVAGVDPAFEDPLTPPSEPEDGVGALGAAVPPVPVAPAAVAPAPSESPDAAVSVPVPPAAGVDAFDRRASRASFLAQPEPLNTIAGADRARFMDPPQTSQADGPGAEIPWMTSTTCPHDSQT